jgi:hypothetical protein
MTHPERIEPASTAIASNIPRRFMVSSLILARQARKNQISAHPFLALRVQHKHQIDHSLPSESCRDSPVSFLLVLRVSAKPAYWQTVCAGTHTFWYVVNPGELEYGTCVQ